MKLILAVIFAVSSSFFPFTSNAQPVSTTTIKRPVPPSSLTGAQAVSRAVKPVDSCTLSNNLCGFVYLAPPPVPVVTAPTSGVVPLTGADFPTVSAYYQFYGILLSGPAGVTYNVTGPNGESAQIRSGFNCYYSPCTVVSAFVFQDGNQ